LITYRTVLATLLATLIGAALPAAAQETAWGDNGYVSFNGLYDASSKSYQTTTEQTINLESTLLTTRHERRPMLVYDLMAGGRVKGNLGFGFAVTYARVSADAEVTGPIPHPFFFDRPRTLSGAVSLDREDLAVHLDAMWLLPVSEAFQIALFGGPTWFQLKQDTIASIEIDDAYPFDAASLGSFTSATTKGSRFGFNAGVDASYFFSQKLGVHALVRYSDGTVDLGNAAASIEVGGVQAGAGIRIRY
jgi:Outer membrane protein beta-barrel domain